MTRQPKLYLVATPIGNYDDITLRAINILKNADFIICEEYKEARRLLAHLNIRKDLKALNEHNEQEASFDIVKELKMLKTAALISDGGTPLFSDPGKLLVKLCISDNIEVIPVPGANSLMPALIASGLNTENFYFYGWLSPKKEIRRRELKQLLKVKELIIILETPYRLLPLLNDVGRIFGNDQDIVLAYKLTMPDEKFYRGKIRDIINEAEKKKLKGEFVLMIENRKREKSAGRKINTRN